MIPIIIDQSNAREMSRWGAIESVLGQLDLYDYDHDYVDMDLDIQIRTNGEIRTITVLRVGRAA